MTDWLHIGRVVAVNVARRQIRIDVIHGRDYVFDDCKRLQLVSDGTAPVLARIKSARKTDAEVIVELTPGISRDVVATLKNADALAHVPTECRPVAVRVGLQGLHGLRVVTIAGDFVGTVIETQDTPAGGIMRLQCHTAVMATAPVTDAFIEKIDSDAGIITVNDLEAFLVVDEDEGRRKSSRNAAQD